MAPRKANLPWNFLEAASTASLQSYELSRLNNAANLRREIGALLDQWVDDASQALLARWMRDFRDRPRPVMDSDVSQPQAELPFGESPLAESCLEQSHDDQSKVSARHPRKQQPTFDPPPAGFITHHGDGTPSTFRHQA